MTKYNLTIGHYASHRNTGGYQPTKSDRPKALNPPKCGGIESLPGQMNTQPSELELRIRKEVMVAIDTIESRLYEDGDMYIQDMIDAIKDRLNLLWGE